MFRKRKIVNRFVFKTRNEILFSLLNSGHRPTLQLPKHFYPMKPEVSLFHVRKSLQNVSVTFLPKLLW